MDFSRVDSLNLTERLDAEFYKPNFLQNEEKLKSLGNTVLLDEALTGLQLGYTGPTEIYYDPEGMYFLSSKNIVNGNLVVTESTDKISFEAHNGKLSKTVVKSGDVLISRTGTVGKCALIGGTKKEFNIAAHLIALRINSKFDSAYISSFFNCHFGKEQSKRLQRGTIIQGLSIFDVPLMRVPNFDRLAQSYIGNKVRQAELLQEWAKVIDDKVNQTHAKMIPDQSNLDFERKTRVVSNKEMTERMDAHFYPGVVDTYLKDNVASFEKLLSCCIDLFNGQTQSESNEESCKQITVTNLSPNFIKGESRLVKKPKTKDKYLKKYDLLICNAAHQKSYIGRDITFNHSNQEILPSTEVMVIRIDRSKIPASYIRTYFQTKLGFIQIQSTIRGITAHSYPVDMAKLEIFIPKLSDKEKIEWFETDEQLEVAGVASEFASALTQVSKLLVEALIEGQITEAQLLEAHQTLEEGDNSKDRAILSKLFDKGYLANDGKPLFTDLDKLYELLDEAKQAVDANEEPV